MLLNQNVWLLFLLAILTYFTVWIFLIDSINILLEHQLFESVLNWLTSNEESSVAHNEISKFKEYEKLFVEFVYPFAYSLFLTVVTSKLIYNVLRAGRTKITKEDVISYFRNQNFGILFDILRTAGVFVCYLGAFFAYFSFVLLPAMLAVAFLLVGLINGELILLFAMISNVLFLVGILIPLFMYVFFGRWSLVVPLAIIEQTNPLKSFKRSWNLTAAIWKQVLTAACLTYLLWYIVIAILYGIEILIFVDLHDVDWSKAELSFPDPMKEINNLFLNGLLGLPISVVISVCYYFGRKTEDGNGTEPEPLFP